MRIVSVLHQKWYLDSFVVDRPVVKVFTDAHGVTNIPVIKSSSSSSSNTSLFDLGIRHAVLDQGAVYYNDRQSALSADLHNVDFRASFDSLLQKYSGKLSYTDGHLQSGSFKPIPHSLDAEFDATPTTFHLTQAKLTSDTSQLVLTATLQDYSHPRVQAHYDATLDASQFRKILENPSLPVGLIRASGTVDYQEIANRSLLDTVVVKGDLNSKQLDVQTPDVRSQIRDIAAHYTLENGDATLTDFRASLLGGVVTSTGKMSNIGGNPHSKFNASLRGIRLADVNRAMKSSAVPKNIALGGVLNAEAGMRPRERPLTMWWPTPMHPCTRRYPTRFAHGSYKDGKNRFVEAHREPAPLFVSNRVPRRDQTPPIRRASFGTFPTLLCRCK